MPRAIFPDVPRLLSLRERFRKLAIGEAASSIPAFIAWKAFLIVSGAENGSSEFERCEASVTRTMERFPEELVKPGKAFIEVLQLFLDRRQATRAVVEDWVLDQDKTAELPRREIDKQVDAVLRDVERLGKATRSSAPRDMALQSASIARELRRVRHAVLGHASVHTGTVLFDKIVPVFEELVTELALLGRARLSGMTPEAAREELRGRSA